MSSWGGTLPPRASHVVACAGDFRRPRGGTGVIRTEDAAIVPRADDLRPARRYGDDVPRPLADLASRVRATDPRRLDPWIAAFFAIEFQIEASLAAAPADLTGRAALLAFAAGLAVRTRLPVVTVAAGFACFVALTTRHEFSDGLVMPYLLLFVVMFSHAVLTDGRELAAGIAVAMAGTALAVVVDPEAIGPGTIVFVATILIAAPVVTARVIRSRMRLAEVLREKAERAERERAEGVAAAVAGERVRIAGELHDVVSHALGAMVVGASAARRLAAADHERARDAFAAVEGEGREALAEMRRLLGVLRRADEEIALAPQPSLDHLSALVRRTASAGLPTAVEVEGERRELPIGADLIAYRVVQEALHEALGSGTAGRAQVRVAYAADHVSVEVRDDGSGRRDLLGVQERVSVYGGRLVAGGGRGGGHTVRARLPTGSAA
jgi:signal transduction histidine kinase